MVYIFILQVSEVCHHHHYIKSDYSAEGRHPNWLPVQIHANSKAEGYRNVLERFCSTAK